MALSFKLFRNRNSSSAYYNKYFAKAVITGELNTMAVAEIIQRNCTVKRSDVVAVVLELIEVLKDALADGKKVRFEGLGSFKPSISGVHADTAEEFSISKHIKGFRVNFTPEYKIVKTGTYIDEEGVEHVKRSAVFDLTKDIQVRQY